MPTIDKVNESLLAVFNDMARIRGKDDMLQFIRINLKQYISFNDSFILRYNKDNRTGRPYIYHAEKQRSENPAFRSYLDFEYAVPDDAIDEFNYPIVYTVASLLPYGSDQISFMDNKGIKELVVVKMINSNQLTGLFMLLSEEMNSFKPEDLDLLHCLSYQIAIATANIMANEELAKMEEEKSILLSLSNEIAAVKGKKELSGLLQTKLTELFPISGFGITLRNDDQETPFDMEGEIKNQPGYEEITSGRYNINDCVFSRVIKSDGPILFQVDELAKEPGVPAYVNFWKEAGVAEVLCIALRSGGTNIGLAFLHLEPGSAINVNTNLLTGVCSYLSVAVSNILANEKIHNQLLEINKYKQQLEQEKIYLKQEIDTTQNYADIIGESPSMKKVFRLVEQVASSASTVLLTGETGTGKELVARAIHNSSSRKNKLMIKVNCAALPVNLIESELFGHERGSFTGATERRLGKFELANKGTLFLDEIGEMPMELQVKLLRAIQEREIERVGGSHTIKVDVRIIAATNRDLEQMMEEGKFRSDLYYRLNIFPIHLPPLRERREDIPALASYFLTRFSKKAGKLVHTFSKEVLRDFTEYRWPGNIREMEHLVERSVLLAQGSIIDEIPLPTKNRSVSLSGTEEGTIRTIDENEKEHILKVIKYCNGKISGETGAATILGIPPSTLNSKMKKLGIKKAFFS